VEDVTMKFAQPSQINNAKFEAKHDATILLTCVAFTIVFLIAIYLASMSPGTALSELASMTVFP
jgi:hypothetical protein